ncbi:uncharacterized protein LOC131024794 [Salvia miltiorrhiza]|uniref:uncharacterized protein LOC131024794 n=1 Tax=Salvia miltiorrhiza TaxID=226208 RepID=UPI0025AD2657|nr:uncharacterized protein LOC131024794 [Salvia miltiorrhiza]
MSATAKQIEAQRENAEIHHGSAACRQKFLELLEEFSVPLCVFLMTEVEGAELVEFGFNRATGFFWLRQKAKTQRKMSKTSTLYYDVEVTGFIEERRLSQIVGVKGKELLVKLPICEIIVGYPTADKVKCVAAAGMSRVSPLTDYQNAAK